jgi:hypothetical protein
MCVYLEEFMVSDSMTERECQMITARLRSSQGLTRIFILLGMVPVLIALVRLWDGDFLGGIIILAVSLVFLLPGTGSFFFAKKLARDVKEKQVVLREETVVSKYFLSRKAFFSYFIKLGKTPYGVKKEAYDRISENDRVKIRIARYSGELMSLHDGAGEEILLG